MLKVGDKVKFKTWDQMVEEYGCGEDGETYIEVSDYCGFILEMAYLCGMNATVTDVSEDEIELDIDTEEWYITEEMVEKI